MPKKKNDLRFWIGIVLVLLLESAVYWSLPTYRFSPEFRQWTTWAYAQHLTYDSNPTRWWQVWR